MNVILRPPAPADMPAIARIIHIAFNRVATEHAFAVDFPEEHLAGELTTMLVRNPGFFGVVAEDAGRIIGSNFLDERGPIRAVGPVSVDPDCQRSGVGRTLMKAVLDRGAGAAGIRLVQDAFNTTSMALYTSLGFATREPLALLSGRPRSQPSPDSEIRLMNDGDIPACAALYERVHGIQRVVELQDLVKMRMPAVLTRGGTVRAYASAPNLWFLNHGVAEGESDMMQLVLGVAGLSTQPLSLLVPTRQSSFFRWCLSEGLRIVKPMTLMSIGKYNEPRGCHYPAVSY